MSDFVSLKCTSKGYFDILKPSVLFSFMLVVQLANCFCLCLEATQNDSVKFLIYSIENDVQLQVKVTYQLVASSIHWFQGGMLTLLSCCLISTAAIPHVLNVLFLFIRCWLCGQQSIAVFAPKKLQNVSQHLSKEHNTQPPANMLACSQYPLVSWWNANNIVELLFDQLSSPPHIITSAC